MKKLPNDSLCRFFCFWWITLQEICAKKQQTWKQHFWLKRNISFPGHLANFSICKAFHNSWHFQENKRTNSLGDCFCCLSLSSSSFFFLVSTRSSTTLQPLCFHSDHIWWSRWLEVDWERAEWQSSEGCHQWHRV